LMNSEIAARLYVSEKTVEFHLTNIYLKFGVPSRRALVKHLVGRSPGMPGADPTQPS